MAQELGLLFTLKARNDATATLKGLESNIASLKARIKEIKAEGKDEIPFKSERLVLLKDRLKSVTDEHKKLKLATKDSADSLNNDLGGALSSVSPKLAALAGSAGPITLAVAAFLAEAAAITLVVKGLIDLGVHTADFQGKLFDLSQQTGVSVDTLNALDIGVSKVGGSIESVVQSLVIFQGKIEEAQDETTKAGKTFKELGISTNDTEVAFREAIKALAALPEGFRQTNDAAELFGRRGGKQVLAFLKDANGDIDGVVNKLGDLARVTREDAKAADEFNDALRDLQILVRGVGAVVGKEVIPQLLTGLKELQKTLKDNKEALDALGIAAKIAAGFLGLNIKAALNTLTLFLRTHAGELQIIVNLYERLVVATQKIGKAVVAGVNLEGSGPQVGADTGGAAFRIGAQPTKEQLAAAKTATAAALSESADAAAKELQAQRALTESLLIDHERRGGDLEQFFGRQQRLFDDHLKILNDQIKAERDINQSAFDARVLNQAEFNDKIRDLNLRAQKAQDDFDEQSRKLKLAKDRALVEEEIRFRESALAIEESRREGELARLEDALERGATTESEVLGRRLEFLKDTQKTRIGIIDFELKADSTSAEQKEQLNTKRTISEQKYTDEFKRLTNERIDAMARETAEAGPSFEGVTREGDLSNFPEPPAMLKTVDVLKDAFEEIKLIGEDAFSSLAQGIGNLIQNWVLLGNTAPGATRKMVAAVLAGVAAEAAVQAIFELAKGFAALFFNPAEAAAHFTAAALFGSIAGVAAVAGRGIAGDLFKQQGAAGGGGGGSRSTSASTTSPAARDIDRNASSPTGGTLHVVLGLQEGIVADHFRRDYDLNGVTRLIVETGKA